MARPKRGSEVPAQERLKEAFWQMLDEVPLAEMTVSSLSRRAGVNHNTFYYYYENLDALAAQMLEQNLIPELPLRILNTFSQGTLSAEVFTSNEDFLQRYQRMCLMAGPHSSSWLKDALKSRVLALWLNALGATSETLDRKDGIVLEFMIGGLLTVLGTANVIDDLSALSRIMEGEMGRGIFSTIFQIAQTYRQA